MAFKFVAKKKLADLLKLNPSHQTYNISLKPSFNHIFFESKRHETCPLPSPMKWNRKVIRDWSRENTLYNPIR